MNTIIETPVKKKRAIIKEKTSATERAIMQNEPRRRERANTKENTSKDERAISLKKTITYQRATNVEKTNCKERPTIEDRLTVRMLVRAREDFQDMRKKMDNRIGRKADGTDQELTEARAFNRDDLLMFTTIADNCREQEKEIGKMLKKTLKRFPVYTEYLLHVKGVGEIAAGWIIGEFDIEKATTVSKMWQFAGLNPGSVQGSKAIDKSKYKPSMGEIVKEYTTKKGEEKYLVLTSEMIKADKLTEGFTSPFNKNLRTALVGVLADGFIKQQNYYAMEFYYPYKARLEQEENTVLHVSKDAAWKEVSKGHRDRAAKRYMIKMFIKDLYAAWREIEGLPVREPYQVEYLGHKHG